MVERRIETDLMRLSIALVETSLMASHLVDLWRVLLATMVLTTLVLTSLIAIHPEPADVLLCVDIDGLAGGVCVCAVLHAAGRVRYHVV